MNNLKKIQILLLMLSLSLPLITNAETIEFIYTRIQVGSKNYFGDDVKKHYEATRLNEDAEARLFLMAGKDWTKYQAQKDETFKKQFNTLLKEFTYLKMLQYDATVRKRRNYGDQPTPKFFQVSQSDFFDLVQKNENKRLEKYLKIGQSIGIVKGRLAFVDEVLKPKGYPHKATETNDDIYWRWYYSEKRRIKAEVFIAHAKQYEFHRSLAIIHAIPRRDSFGNRDNPLRGIYVRPTDLHDFFKGTEKKVSELLVGKELNQTQVSAIVKDNPEISSILKKLQVLTPSDFPISKYADDTSEFNRVKQDLIQNLGPKLNDTLSQNIFRYFKKAYVRTQKYTVAQLQQLKKQSLEKFAFSNQGDYSALMAAYIYDLAEALKAQTGVTHESLEEEFAPKLNASYKSLLEAMKDDSFYLSKDSKADEYLFDTLVENHTGQSLTRSISDAKTYHQKVINLISWIVKFEAKKVSHQYRSTVVIETHEYGTFEGQEAATSYIRAVEFDKGREKFRDDLRVYYNGFLQININSGEEIFSGRSAINFIIEE